MLKHPLTPQWFKLFKKTAAVLFVAEGLAFAGTYFAWYRLNTNRDARHYCHANFPLILEGYYKVGEYLDSTEGAKLTRQQDFAIWAAESKDQ